MPHETRMPWGVRRLRIARLRRLRGPSSLVPVFTGIVFRSWAIGFIHAVPAHRSKPTFDVDTPHRYVGDAVASPACRASDGAHDCSRSPSDPIHDIGVGALD